MDKSFWSQRKKFLMFEPDLEPKTLDAWSQSRIPKFEFRLYSPALAYCSLRYKNVFAKRNLFFVL